MPRRAGAIKRMTDDVDSAARRALIAAMHRARLFLAWLAAFAFLANALSPRVALAAFAPAGFVVCHSDGDESRRPLTPDEACRQHCLALSVAAVAPEPPRFAHERRWSRFAPPPPAPAPPGVAPRHADGQPRGPPSARA